jgi:hypothetical protein
LLKAAAIAHPKQPTCHDRCSFDGAVENLDYVAGTAAMASTNAKGEFTCYAGDTVTFSIGGIAPGSAPCAAIIAAAAAGRRH